MKTIIAMLIASIMLAGTPYALAAHRCDHDGAPSEGIDFPARPGHYLFVDLTQPDKVGEWIEHNGHAGLQTRACFAMGSYRFAADDKVPVLA